MADLQCSSNVVAVGQKLMGEQKSVGDITACTVNEVLGNSFNADDGLHAVGGIQDFAAIVSPCAFGATIEANEDNLTKCISDDRRTEDVVAGLDFEIVGSKGGCTIGLEMCSNPKCQPSQGLSNPKSSPFVPLGFGSCSPSQAGLTPVGGEVAPKSAFSDQAKKSSNPKKKSGKCSKRRSNKTKCNYDEAGHQMGIDQIKDVAEDVSS